MKGLNLRVYRRTLNGIALLWNKDALDKASSNDITVTLDTDDAERHLDFKTSEQVETALDDGITAPDNTVVMMISHERNKIDPYQDVKLNIKFGDKISQDIFVYSFGVLPPDEKDDKKMNHHIYWWNTKSRKWTKAEGVETPEGFALLVTVAKR